MHACKISTIISFYASSRLDRVSCKHEPPKLLCNLDANSKNRYVNTDKPVRSILKNLHEYYPHLIPSYKGTILTLQNDSNGRLLRKSKVEDGDPVYGLGLPGSVNANHLTVLHKCLLYIRMIRWRGVLLSVRSLPELLVLSITEDPAELTLNKTTTWKNMQLGKLFREQIF